MFYSFITPSHSARMAQMAGHVFLDLSGFLGFLVGFEVRKRATPYDPASSGGKKSEVTKDLWVTTVRNPH